MDAKSRKNRRITFQKITVEIHFEYTTAGTVLQLQEDEYYSASMNLSTSTGKFHMKLSMHHKDPLTGINISAAEGMH